MLWPLVYCSVGRVPMTAVRTRGKSLRLGPADHGDTAYRCRSNAIRDPGILGPCRSGEACTDRMDEMTEFRQDDDVFRYATARSHLVVSSDQTVPEILQMTKILLIEDDVETAEELAAELTQRGFEVEHAASGIEGLDKARSIKPDLMVVDRMLPGMDGLTIIEALRNDQIRTPVLILSALGAVDDRVRGLRMGGDDYLTKPFAIVELVARIEALLRRPIETRETMLRVGPLELDLIERTARRGEREIELLPREFRLLEYMMQRNEQLLTRAMLLEEVWNYKFVPDTNLVDVHMGRLRHKVDTPGDPPMIHNVRGAGFILRAPS